jgi:predicted nuclease with TOPRIM domain
MPNQKSLSISGKKYSLQYPIQFIAGDIASMQFDTDLTDLEISWNDIFLQINDDTTPLTDSIFTIYQQLQKEKIPGILNWTEFWADIMKYNLKIEKSTSVLLNLLQIRDLKNTYIDTNNTLQNLHASYEQLQVLQQQQNFKNQVSALGTLNSQFQEFLKTYEMEKDEFDVQKNRMHQYFESKTALNQQLAHLKSKQRDLYQQTNEVTKEIDELDPRIRIYETKLESLDSKKNSEDYNRIFSKNQVLRDQYNSLKEQRTTFMDQSKDLNRKTSILKKQFRESSTKIRKYEAEYRQAQESFKLLDAKHKSMKSRILELEQSVNSLINKNGLQKEHISSELGSSPYTSKRQLENIIADTEKELHIIENQLVQIFKSTERTEIDSFISGKLENVIKTLEILEKQSVSPKISKYGEEIAFFLQFLSDFETIYSTFLKNINLSFHISFGIGNDDRNFTIDANYLKKDQKLQNFDSFNRWEKSYVFISLIIANFIALNKDYMPIRVDSLPPALITEKTFLKVTKMLKSVIDTLDRFDNRQILFFLSSDAKKIAPIITIDD